MSYGRYIIFSLLLVPSQKIVSRCDGKIIIIDTGISHAYGGVLSALSIHYELHPVGKDGQDRWVERETVNALYEHHQVVVAEDEREIVGSFHVSSSRHNST